MAVKASKPSANGTISFNGGREGERERERLLPHIMQDSLDEPLL